MGSGESTAKRISMQKTDEGVVQISENVMWMLSKNKENDSTGLKDEGKEQAIVELLKEAYLEGRNSEKNKLAVEREGFNAKEKEWENKMKNLNEKWKHRFEQRGSVSDETSKHQVEQTQKELESIKNQLNEDKEAVQKTLEEKSIVLKQEFEKSVQEIEQRIKPLYKSPCCHELLSKVEGCYKTNRNKPLHCSNIVTEYINCVQTARMASLKDETATS